MMLRLALLLAFAMSLGAAPFSRLVVFGDSLSDTGNLFSAIGFPPSPPYFEGRGTNGPVAVEYLQAALGLSDADVENYAFYGATTGAGNIIDSGTPATSNGLPGVLLQYMNALDAGFTVSPTDLYVILGGPPNDFRVDLSLPALQTALTNQIQLVMSLQLMGAQNIIIGGVPDLGRLPGVAAAGPAVAFAASSLSQLYNAQLQGALPAGVRYLDLEAILNAALADPSFTNTTTPCLFAGSVCSNPNEYVFWDEFHPTTRVHQLAGEALLASAIPEPAAILTVAGGFGVLMVLRRRRAAGRRR
jgi:phospholipase/lecithinase/hemolysin